MGRKVTITQAMDALALIRSEAKGSQIPAIEVLESDLYNRSNLNNKLAEAELRASRAESKLLKFMTSSDGDKLVTKIQKTVDCFHGLESELDIKESSGFGYK